MTSALTPKLIFEQTDYNNYKIWLKQFRVYLKPLTSLSISFSGDENHQRLFTKKPSIQTQKYTLYQEILREYFSQLFDLNFFDYQLYDYRFLVIPNKSNLKFYFQSYSDNMETFISKILKIIDSPK